MSLRLEMLQVARLAPRLLGESADLVRGFVRSRMTFDGGFRGRGETSDLYYTVFGIECLIALREDLPAAALASYLKQFGDGEGLDLPHLCCLPRGWADLPAAASADFPRESLLKRLEAYRSADGAYGSTVGAAQGTVYGCFLAVGAYQDCGLPLPDPDGILKCLDGLRAEDGGYANQHDMPVGLTPPTAAVAALFRQLGRPAPPDLADWLLSRCRPDGGFFATPVAPIPDLLSTATALHALAGLHADLRPVTEPCLDFLDTLWTNEGSFHGNWDDDLLDCEYTFYALLALGHLSL